MPNWCSNRMVVTGKGNEIDLFLGKAKGKTEGKELAVCLESLIPTPKELLKDGGWYQWRLANWGSKWDLCEVSDVRRKETLKGLARIELCYETAWSPVSEAVRTLSEMFPRLEFYHDYLEENIGFIGYETYRKGKIVKAKSKSEADLFQPEGKEIKRKIAW